MSEPPLHDWRAAVAQELKGRSAESLRGTSDDGVTLEPLYTVEHARGAPPLRGNGSDASWQILAEMRLADPAAATAASKLRFNPAPRYSGVERTAQPLAHPAGQEGRRRQALVPVSNAATGGTSAAGAPSWRYWSRNGRNIRCRNSSAV